MTEKRVRIWTGNKKGVAQYLEGTWIDNVYDGCGAYAVVADTDGDVHLVSFYDLKVIE